MQRKPLQPSSVFILLAPGSDIFFDSDTNEIQSRVKALPANIVENTPRDAGRAKPKRSG